MNDEKYAVQFSRWMRWQGYSGHSGIEHPGVYLLGKFDSPPPTISHIDRNVIYVGETVDHSLAERLYQFGRSAFQRKEGHPAGWTLFNRLLDRVKQDDAPPWLYVALFPVALGEPFCSAYIRFVERSIIWDYVQAWNELPTCNKE